VIEAFAWETQAGFAVHVLNYTNPAMHRGWIRQFYPVGGQKVRMSLPAGRRVTRVELLRAERNIPFTGGSGTIEFTIPERTGLRSRGALFGMRLKGTAPPMNVRSTPMTQEIPSVFIGVHRRLRDRVPSAKERPRRDAQSSHR
jgi:hypothetical protein